MEENVAISVKNLKKVYTKRDRLKHFSLKASGTENFLALKNINLEIRKNEIVCISGPNGSGKSTFLKLIAEVTPPTEGEIEINGKVASILEIGIGFQQEMSGYENIFLSGAMYGISKADISKKIDKIIDLFGFPDFINTPVKYYSSGMYMRLAFSVTINIDADIYLFDEVTSVGDIEFRNRVIKEIDKLKNNNATVIIVTHTPTLFSKICNKFLFFEKGEISTFHNYQDFNAANISSSQLPCCNSEQLAATKIISNFCTTLSFDILSIAVIADLSDIRKIFDDDILIKLQIRYSSTENFVFYMKIEDALGSTISSIPIQLEYSDTTIDKEIKIILKKGILNPFSMGINFDIYDKKNQKIISYPRVINFPCIKTENASGYINIPFEISID